MNEANPRLFRYGTSLQIYLQDYLSEYLLLLIPAQNQYRSRFCPRCVRTYPPPAHLYVFALTKIHTAASHTAAVFIGSLSFINRVDITKIKRHNKVLDCTLHVHYNLFLKKVYCFYARINL